MSERDPNYVTVRELMRGLIGQRLVDITQHDQEEFEETGESYVMLMFEHGVTLKIPIDETCLEIEGLDVAQETLDKLDVEDEDEGGD